MSLFSKKSIEVPVEVSARHVHLSQPDLEKLFGTGYQLKKLKQLTQPSDFACKEVVDIKNAASSKVLSNIRVVGPVREKSQVELSLTDAISLGVNPPVRLSGDLAGSAGITLTGPAGEIQLSEGLIIARRHIHCSTEEAKKMDLKNGQIVSVKIDSERPVTFHGVIVRIKDDYKLCLHLDTDEGNAAGIKQKANGFLLR